MAAARAIWKGSLKVGFSTVPIKMYAAVQDRDIHFHLLQNRTKSRVKQEMVSEDREQVEKAQIRKGYEVEPGTFVIVEASELEQLKPKESRLIIFGKPLTRLCSRWPRIRPRDRPAIRYALTLPLVPDTQHNSPDACGLSGVSA